MENQVYNFDFILPELKIRILTKDPSVGVTSLLSEMIFKQLEVNSIIKTVPSDMHIELKLDSFDIKDYYA
jgi:hypothetical protein